MEEKEPKYIIPENEEEIKKDEPAKEKKFKLNLNTMKISEVTNNEE